jgi:lipopolysaccharide/colanic/teichoic acid biosynthesis glycosyltransferase
MIKRLFDITVSLLGLCLVMPLMILVSLLIKFESKGSVIFRQERVGLLSKTFSIYKLRSMVVDAESQGPHFTSATDVRVTRVGRFIRKTSLDELPQLLNVLFGDMSLVGPRPNVPKQKVEYSEAEWDKRNSIRPGITGLAQAKLRSAATPEQRTQLDLEYVDKASLYFDMDILLMTVKQVLFKGGN